MTTARPGALTAETLAAGWREAGVEEGMALIVHSSLSGLGRVEGGATAVVESLRTAVGEAGTVAVPAFTWQVTDPDPEWVGVPDEAVEKRRAAVPLFHPGLETTSMGAIAEALRTLPRPSAVRTRRPRSPRSGRGPRRSPSGRRSAGRSAGSRRSGGCTIWTGTSCSWGSGTTAIRSCTTRRR